MTRIVYPGSFDPVTKGHINIIERASKMFDEVFIVLLNNPDKQAMFSIELRTAFIETIIKEFPNVSVCSFQGLTADVCKMLDIQIILRGVRNMVDYEYESQIAAVNSHLNKDLETIFMISDPRFNFISSSNMKAIALHNGDISSYVTKEVEDAVKKYYHNLSK